LRIISLIASSTETVCALGFEDQLVGRSHECDYPPSVMKLPACSEPKINIDANSKEIDDQVKNIVSDGLSVYKVDIDRLKELKPDIIITQDQCEVCAVSLKDVEQALSDWMVKVPKLISLKPYVLNDLWNSFDQIADALGNPEKGVALKKQCQERMTKISSQANSLGNAPTICCIEWFDPLMIAGNWVPELVHLLGGIDPFAKPGEHSSYLSFEELLDHDPDIIVSMPCGWDIQRSRREIDVLLNQVGWKDLQAVKNNRVYLTDGNQYFNRPGPRLVDSLEILAEIVYPDHFHYGYEGRGWLKLNN